MALSFHRTLAALLVLAFSALTGLGQAAPITFDLDNGTIDNGVRYDSGQILLAPVAAPLVVTPAAPTLVAWIDFKGHQLLKLTDTGNDALPFQEEQIFTAKFIGPGDPNLQQAQIIQLDATIKVALTGVSGALAEPNPDVDDAICVISRGSTECTNISLGYGDLTDKMISFKDIHFTLTMDPGQIMQGMFNDGLGGVVANLNFNAVQFSAFADLVVIGVPEPETVVLMGLGLFGIGWMRNRCGRWLHGGV